MILLLGMGGSIGVYLLTFTVFSMVFNKEGTYFGSDADLFFWLIVYWHHPHRVCPFLYRVTHPVQT